MVLLNIWGSELLIFFYLYAMNKNKRVALMLSGGVDSSVAAFLLKQQGYEVLAVFMKNWHDETVTINNECPWVEDSTDALMVAQKLDIPYYVYDFSKEYKSRIVDYMFSEYQSGRTPNPDVLCNREIKFDVFLAAAEKLKADFVATGHYCRKDVVEKEGSLYQRLLAGADPNKDQSYFLCQLNQQQLERVLFPIGHLQKSQVRHIAMEQQLVTAEKKDSQGLCFIGKVKLPVFLQQQLKAREGQIIMIPAELPQLRLPEAAENWPNATEELLDAFCLQPKLTPEMGKTAGKHNGAHFFTIGQRKGLNIGGMPEGVYVIGVDTRENIIYSAVGENHPGLMRPGLRIQTKDVHWIRPDLQLKANESRRFLARIRYRQPLNWATFIMREEFLYVIFDNLQKGIAPGQFVAWYDDDECIGSGVIA
jgi:tRNA-uridine 2-sulfurtransferase